MKCKYCGSQYVSKVSSTNTLKGMTIDYICESCHKNFQRNIKKRKAPGEWLITFKEKDFYTGKPKIIAEFFKTDTGEIDVNFCMFLEGDGWYYTKYIPEISLEMNYNILDLEKKIPKIYCVVDLHPGSTSMLDFKHKFKIDEIETSEHITNIAIKNEAMKIIHEKDNLFITEKSINYAVIDDVCKWIKSIFPERRIKKQGCYVATTIYGSYDCPQVWTLRRYRDNTLAKTWYGRAFIRTYYTISPTLVKWFGNTTWFKKMWKGKLDKIVAKLRENGVESTPYEDKNW